MVNIIMWYIVNVVSANIRWRVLTLFCIFVYYNIRRHLYNRYVSRDGLTATLFIAGVIIILLYQQIKRSKNNPHLNMAKNSTATQRRYILSSAHGTIYRPDIIMTRLIFFFIKILFVVHLFKIFDYASNNFDWLNSFWLNQS